MLIQTDTGIYTKVICPQNKTLGYTSSQINSEDSCLSSTGLLISRKCETETYRKKYSEYAILNDVQTIKYSIIHEFN